MKFYAILNTEIGLLPEAEIAGRGSLLFPTENKTRQDMALLQLLHRAAKAAGANRHHCWLTIPQKRKEPVNASGYRNPQL